MQRINRDGKLYTPVTVEEYGEYHNLTGQDGAVIGKSGVPYVPVTQEQYREMHERYMELERAVKNLTVRVKR